jgi:hypothetical protein
MKKAQENDADIDVYINPSNPSESTIDPGIRWFFILFGVPLALMGVALGASMVMTWMQR